MHEPTIPLEHTECISLRQPRSALRCFMLDSLLTISRTRTFYLRAFLRAKIQHETQWLAMANKTPPPLALIYLSLSLFYYYVDSFHVGYIPLIPPSLLSVPALACNSPSASIYTTMSPTLSFLLGLTLLIPQAFSASISNALSSTNPLPPSGSYHIPDTTLCTSPPLSSTCPPH